MTQSRKTRYSGLTYKSAGWPLDSTNELSIDYTMQSQIHEDNQLHFDQTRPQFLGNNLMLSLPDPADHLHQRAAESHFEFNDMNHGWNSVPHAFIPEGYVTIPVSYVSNPATIQSLSSSSSLESVHQGESEQPPKSRRRKVAAEKKDTPPRPLNSFMLYRKDKQAWILSTYQGTKALHNNAVSKVVAEMWRNESDDVRAMYAERADQEKIKHLVKYPGYKYQPRKPQKNTNTKPEAKVKSEPFYFQNQIPKYIEEAGKPNEARTSFRPWNNMQFQK